MDSKEIYSRFRQRMQQHGDQELIGLFNQEVGKPGWGTARACYLAAIHAEWTARGFDYSLVGDAQGLSFRHKVRLVDGVIR
jgi:hypothetical protein